MTSLFTKQALALSLAAAGLVAATAIAQPANKATTGATPPPPTNPTRTPPPTVGGVGQGAATGVAPQTSNANPDVKPTTPWVPPMPATMLCANGFSPSKEMKGQVAGKQVYSSYTCSGKAPLCPAARAAAEKQPWLDKVERKYMGEGTGAFQINAAYKNHYEYDCNTPTLQCLPKAQNGNPNHVNVEVKRDFTGADVFYTCSYVWNQG